jgi:hypothetical protein
VEIHILSSLVDEDETIDFGRFRLTSVKGRRWGGDIQLIQGGHHRDGPEVIALSSCAFDYDVIRMARFVLEVRQAAPWIVIILLIDETDVKSISEFPQSARERLAHYFQCGRSLLDLESYIKSNFDRIVGALDTHRMKYFGTHIVTAEIRSRMEQYVMVSLRRFQYDFAISFSGPDRPIAREVATYLKGRDCRIFFDEAEAHELVGEHLGEKLYEIYSEQSRYCIMLVSRSYSDKAWTTHERRAALDRALKERQQPYIFPVKLEDVDLPGLSSSIGYLSYRGDAIDVARVMYVRLIDDLAKKPAPPGRALPDRKQPG